MEVSAQLNLLATTFNKEQLLTQLDATATLGYAQVALAGRSNVGKSSLINALGNRKQLAKISSTPGKTRSINFYEVMPDKFALVDLPGYGYAKCSQSERNAWAKLIEFYLTTSKLKALIVLLDCRLPPQDLDVDLLSFARSKGIPIVPVLTKADKCTQLERSRKQQEWAMRLDGQLPLAVSSKTGRGVPELWEKLRIITKPDLAFEG